jgi:hypothetical protein
MAKEKSSTVAISHKTTIVFTPKSVLEELEKSKRNATKRTKSISGTVSEAIAAAAEDKHLDRQAFNDAYAYAQMDDVRLHLRFLNFLHYCEVLGVTKRATAQEELFSSDEVTEPVGTFRDADDTKSGKGPKLVASEGRATRETAGAE